MESYDNEKMPKNAVEYVCKKCDFKCSKHSNFTSHLSTLKHKKITIDNNNMPETYNCNCGNKYKHMSGLSRHKLVCKYGAASTDIVHINPADVKVKYKSPYHITPELVIELIKDNSEIKQLLTELVKHNGNVVNSNNNINNSVNNNNVNNKTFNLQIFLNETCKDAMNMMDFIESIELQIEDLELVGKVGYAEGISAIIANKLQSLDITQRPVHCTDKKRETIYVKDENKWEKDDDKKTKIRKLIRSVANKNRRLLPHFREKHPDYKNSKLKISDIYDKIVLEAMGGPCTNNDEEIENKIIHSISNCTAIEKNAN